ncbi:YigZ family protein [Roseibium polysiphoniae]|uniref:YigZ family protein n=1 Tax=Roseibium polysiphoniae TaxID=2571221 RepID=A0ABR9CFJ8_9HYPH|nr:YigZ family protein [Roseibium polysiphoniae]MBD8877835.1 YigZ family protein [Roseibium polysiphoniae]
MGYLTIDQEAGGALEDRKSRFLAHLVPYAQFGDRLDALRKEHRKANHFVTAHRHLLDDGRVEESGKDDGEPSGTSGMPTLKVLQGAKLIEVAVIVVRYFGGIKLGGGGLARGYSGAASDAIAHASLVPFVKIARKNVEATFAEGSELERRVSGLSLTVVSREYTATGVILLVEGPEETLKAL